jgi:hypothetical protein
MSKEPEVSIMKIILHLYEAGANYLGYALVAIAGGVANYLSKLRTGEIQSHRCVTLLADLFISAFAGVMGALLAISLSLQPELVYASCGISGHLGTRFIFLMQEYLLKRLNLKSTSKD